jgi:RNA-directed DNA polymerase
MQESHGKGPASHPDPESCASDRKVAGEALTGAHAGQPLSCEIRWSGVPTPLSEAEGHTAAHVPGEPAADPAQSKTLRTRGNSLHGNREIPPASAVVGAAANWASSSATRARSRSHSGHLVLRSLSAMIPQG